jgi:hypothetical protein
MDFPFNEQNLALHEQTVREKCALPPGEDYLYPKALFRSIALPRAVRQTMLAA